MSSTDRMHTDFHPYLPAADLTVAAAMSAYGVTATRIASAVADAAAIRRPHLDTALAVGNAVDALTRTRRGRVYLAAAEDGTPRGVRMIKRCVRGHLENQESARAIRRVVRDDVPAMLQNREHLTGAQQDAILGAYLADGPAVRADRDDSRRWSAIRTNVREATGAAAWADAVTQVREVSNTRYIRTIREQNLDTALANRMRIHHATMEPSAAGDYDATLCAPISERSDRAMFAVSFAATLADAVDASPNAAVRTIPRVLAEYTADAARCDAVRYRGAADAADAAATSARVALDAAKDTGATAAVIKSADKVWRDANATAADAHRIAALAVQVFVTLRDRGAVTLADMVAMSVYSPTLTAGTKIAGATRRAAADASRWDRGAVLTLLGLSPAANGRVARALDAAVTLAAERALDTAVADAVTLPNMAPATVAYRSLRWADAAAYMAHRNAVTAGA